MAHAYFVAGKVEEGVARAHTFATKELGMKPERNPDVTTLRYSLFPVEEARRIGEMVSRAPLGEQGKLIIIATDRIFHEAQNALLKVFEEPGEATMLILIVPSEGVILPTLRSRLTELPGNVTHEESEAVRAFLAKPGSRATVVERILNKAKSDKADEKQAARQEARELVEGVVRAAYAVRRQAPTPDLDVFLTDLDHFMPILFERSAPLKPILEHLLIAMPQSMGR